MSRSFLRNSSKRCIQRLLERRSILVDFSVSIETPSLTKQQWRSYAPSPLLFKKFKQSGLSPSLHSSSLSSSYSVSSSSSSSTSKNGFVGWYLGLIESRPILTKSVTSGLIYVAADLSSQKISQTPSETYNWIRTLRMCGYGMLIMGPSLHFWFNFVSKILPKRDVLTTFKKIILGQTVYGPIMTSVFFSVNAGLQGENAAEIVARLKRDLLPTFKNGLLYWPMCDFVTFKFIPVRLQILHSGNTNKNAFKTLIAAEYSGVQVELVKNFEMGISNKTPEFLKMNPIGKIPVLETPDGPIFESNAIARYVTHLKESNPLNGSSVIECGHIEQWIDFASLEIDSNILHWLSPRMGYAVYLPLVEEAAITALKRALSTLNTHLASNTYLVGHSVTLADIIMTCNLYFGFRHVMTKSFTSEFPHVERYFWTMVNQPNFHKVLGEVKQTESILPVPSKKPKESAKPKAKDEPKKATKEVKEPAKPKVEEEATEEEEAPKPKPKNPLDLLPPSKMVLDEWKRLYSNTKTNFREVAIKGFWDMYDPEGYSLWFCDYKYDDENTVSFVTLNKVGGFLQRMDLARKYAFGKMLVIGSNPPYRVKGLWLFRGQEIPQFIIDECYDMELYEWRKVDISDEAQKERVSQMIEDQEPFEGEALLDAKCFK